MNSRKKSIFIFIGGLLSGVVLTFLTLFLLAPSTSNGEELQMFASPEREIAIRSFRVIQVVSDGNALAMPTDVSHYGTVVLFLSGDKMTYYDAQQIVVPRDKKLMQVGTYRYVTRDTTLKTIPVVQIMDR